MTNLSPAAQTVLTAAEDAYGYNYSEFHCCANSVAAAALRAATADKNKQIDVPFSKVDQWEEIKGSTLSYWTAAQWGYQKAMNELLSIADELETAQ